MCPAATVSMINPSNRVSVNVRGLFNKSKSRTSKRSRSGTAGRPSFFWRTVPPTLLIGTTWDDLAPRCPACV